MATEDKYIPALRFHWLTPVYDPLTRWSMREKYFKSRLIRQAGIDPAHRVLDLGCGTGTLTIQIKEAQPEAAVVGLDGDPRVLAIAEQKAKRLGKEIKFDQGLAYHLPYPAESFDRVLSSLVFHHLTKENKLLALQEIFRVLKGGGEFHLADFGPPRGAWSSLISPLMARLEEVSDHHKGFLPGMIQAAGFASVLETEAINTFFGTLVLIRAIKADLFFRARGGERVDHRLV